MNKNILVVLFLLLFVKVNAQENLVNLGKSKVDSIKLYLKEALDLMKKRSVNSSRLNWEEIYKNANAAAENAKTIADTYPIIKKTLLKLEDSHSKFFSPKQVEAYLLGYRKTGQQFPEIKSAILEGSYAYIQLPSFASFNFEEWDEYVKTFWDKIAELESKHPMGWMIDIRDNEGGMFVPMYAAISPFLNQRKVIGWKDGLGKYIFMKFKNGRFYENDLVTHQFKMGDQKIKIAKTPIVVLINQGTASSGEFAAISFVGQKNISFVGTKTTGLTSANQEHKLSNGAFLVLTEGNTIDRNKKEYAEVGKGLQPDYPVDNIGSLKSSDDSYLKRAIEVINEKISTP
ncbi:S41 family peptidase [Pedobacter sp. ASV28]|uniref:S41 family peptidase n=1 Tax=Pedobacter sp. ASV28 TaxID=2795123 RepID=UPI0018EA9635|nr:S41 family peptidase [Pedobacter sp. ASV28]